jgi:hypothetical protein
MKLSQLKQLIQEEIDNSLNEATGGRLVDQVKQACIDYVNSEDFAEWRKAPSTTYYYLEDKDIQKFLKAAQGNINTISPDLIRAIYKLGLNDDEAYNFISDAIEEKDK